MKNLRLFIFLLATLPMITLAQDQKVEKTFSGIDEIEISVGPGDAIFTKSPDNKVYLTLTHNIDDYQPTIEQKGDRLKIREENRNGSWSGSATWRFQIPDDTEISFNTGSGDFEISGLSAEVNVNSGSGDLDINDFNGEIKGNTGSGDINFDKAEGDFRMNTGSGDVDGNDIKGYMTFNTGSGEIEVKNLVLTDDSGFNSGSGDVEISLGGPLNYDISLNSGSGDSVLDFNGNKIEGTIVMQANKRSGRIVAPFKFDKEEEIDNGGRNNVTMKKTAKIGNKDVRINIGTGSGTAEVEK